MCRIEIEQFVNKITGDFYLFNSYCKFTLSLKSENIDEAVKNAVEYCIDNNILADFLRKNKAEVIPVAIYECNMDEVLEKIGNDRYEDGKEDFLLSKIKIKHLKGKSSEQIADELEESIDTINEYIKQLKTK